MIVLSRRPVSLPEVKALTTNLEEKENLNSYLKSFCKLSKTDADKITEELRALNNLKIRNESIVKIIDFLPKTSEDLSKIFNEVSLTEEETNAILNIVKDY